MGSQKPPHPCKHPGEVTCKGADHKHDLVIDLAWYNEAAIQANTFTNLKIDWEGSLGSDHALLQVLAFLGPTCHPAPSDTNLGFMMDPDLKGDWIKTFKACTPLLLIPFSPTAEEVEQAAVGLISDIQDTNENIFRRRCPFHPKVAPWWNSACAIAAQNLHQARSTATKAIASACLKGTVHAAKRNWANNRIESDDLWAVVAWCHGHRVSKVPSLCRTEGLVHSHEEIADLLSNRFFAKTPPQVAARFYDNPPQHPAHHLPQIDKDLIDPLIRESSNRSAPGQSSHTWTVIKWAWEVDTDWIMELLAGCLRAGHHLRQWKEAVMCVIPKPGQADYSLVKNYQPISLLECLGKHLEKLVACLLYRDMAKHSLIPTMQFGGHNASSALDTSLTLLHDIQSAHQASLYTGLLLFDIQGFFNNINHE